MVVLLAGRVQSRRLWLILQQKPNTSRLQAAKEGVWIRKFLIELGVFSNASNLLDLFCDNSGVIEQAMELRNHQKSIHVMRWFHLIREFVERGEIKICKIHTDLNVSDPLMKPLPQPKHEVHIIAMGIRYILD